MAVLFVFFAAQFGVVGLLAERRNGTLARMLASPVAPSTILFGKVLVSFVLAAVSMGVVVLATTQLMGASWGDPVAVTALVLATAAAATGIATLVVGFARTEEQAGGAIAIVAMSLAVLGGSFFPLSQAPESLVALSVITPHAWFLRGVGDLAAGGGIDTVLTPLAILLAVAAVTGGLGLARARRVVVP
jgi:ABC-2 type transport system permease protein